MKISDLIKRVVDNIILLFSIVLSFIIASHYFINLPLVSFSGDDILVALVMLILANIRKEADFLEIIQFKLKNPYIKIVSLVYILILTLFFIIYSIYFYNDLKLLNILIAILICIVGFFSYITVKYVMFFFLKQRE